MIIQEVTNADNTLLKSINYLLPQLTGNAKLLSESYLNKIIFSEASKMIVAREKDEILGILTLVLYTIPTGEKAWIEDVVVSEKARGKGVGHQLMEFAINLAKELGAESVNLTSRPSREAANRLYQKMGFELRETNMYSYKF